MLGLILSILTITSVPATDLTRQFSLDVSLSANETIVLQDDSSNIYDLELQYTFFTNVQYNNDSDFVVEFSGFYVDLFVYDSTNDEIYTSSDSFYLDHPDNLTPYDNHTLQYSIDDVEDEFIIDIDYGSGTDSFHLPFAFTYTRPMSILFNDSVSLFWSTYVYTQVPLLINSNSLSIGYEQGYSQGYVVGKSDGYNTGYADGIEYASNLDDTALTIFEGIITVALVPINFFLAIFNFEIFGINISGFVSALLTVSIIIIIVRFLTGKKQDD